MEDGRTLTYYDFAPQSTPPPYLEAHRAAARQHPPTGPRVLEKPPHLRWNPVLAEWTVYAPARMSRPMLPAAAACPLCPGILELPLPYQVAIFENRAPGLAYIPGAGETGAAGTGTDELPDTREAFEIIGPARGRCDIVAYSQRHDARFFQLPLTDIYGLVEAWRARYRELMALPFVRCVTIFENKGREAGMTLDHPHGQIYAMPFLPPLTQRKWDQTRAFAARGESLWQRVIAKEQKDGVRVLAQTEGFLMAQPFYARYPYEVHIWSKRAGVSSLLEMAPQERRELAGLLKNITTRYENLWPNAKYGFPTLMLMQQLSALEAVEEFRFHVEFYPLQRSPDKLKYRASIESGAGTFLNDATPEAQAAELRATAPHDVKLPPALFNDDV
jgi:UDPglucose--hexose-1-phosphate uridylyltransferase